MLLINQRGEFLYSYEIGRYSLRPANMFWTLHGQCSSTLVATIHALTQTEPRLQTLLTDVVPSVDILVLEADTTEPYPGWGVLARGTLRSIVGKPTWAKMEKLASAFGIDVEYLDTLQVWAADQHLYGAILRRAGAQFDRGVDSILREGAERSNKRIRFLESLGDQHRWCTKIPLVEQVSMLRFLLDEPQRVTADFELIQHAWRTADCAALDAYISERARRFPGFVEHMITARNRCWATTLVELATSTSPAIVAVGALHFAGPFGLIALLERQGFIIRQWPAA